MLILVSIKNFNYLLFNSFQLLLTAEGTRFTTEKHKNSLKFAKEKGLPELKHHLVPRTKGFTSSVPHMRGKVPAIYDVQLAIKKYDTKMFLII